MSSQQAAKQASEKPRSGIAEQGRAYCVPETGTVYFDSDLAYLTAPRGSSLQNGIRYIGPPESGLASERDLIKEAMGDWLGKLAPWDVFATWTFSRPAGVKGVLYMVRRHLKWVENVAGVPIYAFVAVESGDVNGRLHAHALIGNVAHLKPFCGVMLPPGEWGRPCCLLHGWPCGHARVLPYDPALGAKHYVSKYVVKSFAAWELIGFPAKPQMVMKRIPNLKNRRCRNEFA